ncbi:MAG: hypothetical protein ABL895_14815 [Cyclobacteriaceae bacterium]
MKIIYTILILVPIRILAQEAGYKNSIYLEAGGNAYAYSINCDRNFDVSTKFKLVTRIGFGTYLKDEPYIIPLEVTALIGKQKNFFEFGTGYTFADDGFLTFRAGYRFERNRSLFRVGLLYFPFFTTDDTITGMPWAGLSYGYRFTFKKR